MRILIGWLNTFHDSRSSSPANGVDCKLDEFTLANIFIRIRVSGESCCWNRISTQNSSNVMKMWCQRHWLRLRYTQNNQTATWIVMSLFRCVVVNELTVSTDFPDNNFAASSYIDSGEFFVFFRTRSAFVYARLCYMAIEFKCHGVLCMTMDSLKLKETDRKFRETVSSFH